MPTEVTPDSNVVTTLEPEGASGSQPVQPSQAPNMASPEPEQTQEPSLEISDDLKNLLETFGEENIMGALQGYAQYAQEQEVKERERAQAEWDKAQSDQRNAWREARDNEFQKIMRESLSKAKPPSEEAYRALEAKAWDEANWMIQERMTEEKAAQKLGQYIQHSNQANYEKQQIYEQRPDLSEYSEYINDLVDRQGFPAKAVISRLDETLGFLKKIGRLSDKPSIPTPEYPTHQGLRQMGTMGSRHLHAVPPTDDKEEQKEIASIVDLIVNS